MDGDFIVTAFVVIDKTMAALGHRDDVRARASDAEVLTVAVVAAKYFQCHLGRYLSGPLSVSRFSRRLPALRGWLYLALETLGALFATGGAFLIDSMPVPVCRRARARRCRKLHGRAFCGTCAAKREKFFGWRLHPVCTAASVPVACDLLPARSHDHTPVHELCHGLPEGIAVYGDKADNSAADKASLLADTGVGLVPIRRGNMRPNDWADKLALQAHRRRIETRYSQLAAMCLQRLHAALLAAIVTNGH